jgi:lipid II isoglutaminyl synthase (glutamine-hydrolysing)
MDCKLFHFYPDLMSLYGSYANVALLERHLKDLGNTVTVTRVRPGETADLSGADFLFLGAGTERSQRAAAADLLRFGPEIKAAAADGAAMLFAGTAMELLGASVTTAGGETYPGIGLADFTARQGTRRIVGDVYGATDLFPAAVVGFMNKCAVLSGVETPLLTSLAMGFGNEAERSPEGFHRNNVFASELTGPLLVKNPLLLGAVIAALYARRGQPLPEHIPAYPFEEQAYAVTAQQLKLRAEAGR